MTVPTNAQRVLIVEDSWLLSVQVETWLDEDGVACAGVAANVRDALDLADSAQPGFALVDFNLGGQPADALIADLTGRGIKVIVVTGYSDIGDVPGVCCVLHKPCTKHQILSALYAAGLTP
ncbi:MAG: response regulator [Hyphomonadaceae bacterium]